MIKRYRIHSSLMQCRGIFEMVIEGAPQRGCTLAHMRQLIFEHEKTEVPANVLNTFDERFKEIEVLGNSVVDLIPSDFRQWAMGDALCHRFWREEYVLQTTQHLERQRYLCDPLEWEQQLDWWRESSEDQFLALAGVTLSKTPKKRAKSKSAPVAST